MEMMEHLQNPRLDEALGFAIQNHLEKAEKTMLIIIGDCQIKYNGRAKSFLDWGDRLVILKEDGTVIVHQPKNREPVNWQPYGTKTRFHLKDELFTVRSMHYKKKEKMNIFFRKIKMILAPKMHDKKVLQIVGMEKDIVEKIVENPEVIEPGLRIKQREKQTSCGMIDIYGYDENHIPVVIEVKRSQASISAVQQLRMYIKDLKKGRKNVHIRGILCAPRIPEIVRKLLDDYSLEYKEFGWQHEIQDNRQKRIDDY